MELRLKSLFAALGAGLLVVCASAPTRASRSLASFIDQAIATPPFDHALWGILVEEQSGLVVYEKNADVLMMPASNRKLFIAALATECLGVASTIPTELWISGFVEGNRLQGDLVLKGYGDPSLGGRYEYDRDERLQPFLDAVRARGIEAVSGSIVADVSRFDRETIPGSWKYDNLGGYDAAPVDALAWNENVVGILLDARDCSNVRVTTDPGFVPGESELACSPRTDPLKETLPTMRTNAENNVVIRGAIDVETASRLYGNLVAVENPGLYAAQALDDFLRRNAVSVEMPPTLNLEPREWSEKLATIHSPPLYELLATFLKVSQNLYGEMFFKLSAGEVPAGYDAARWVERLFLVHEVRLDPTEFDFADGSGLSVENLVTPRAIIQLLRYMNRPERYGLYYELLATPGGEGTLRRRLAGLEASMRGKTGSIDHVNALSGYVIGRGGRLRYFSILANHHTGESSAAIRIIDQLTRRIADF